jgi:DeoR family transcriptional regulator, suf operon transcriptional repressor
VAEFKQTERILETTRGRVLALLRRGDMSTDELAGALGLTDNAIRAHLATLERDGLVHTRGERREGRIGKPATLYTASPEVDILFSRAYIPLLTSLLSALGDRLTAKDLSQLLEDVGGRLAAGVTPSSGELSQRVAAASNLLNELGGLSSVQEVDQGQHYMIQSRGCPLGLAVSEQSEVCEAIVTLLSKLTGAEVRSCCQRTGRPSCCFEIRPADTGPRTSEQV